MRAGLRERPAAAELLLPAVTLTLILSADRLTTSWAFLAPLAGAAAVAHVVVALVRRGGRSIALGAVLSLLCVAGEQLWVYYPHTTRYGLPQRATAVALGDDLAEAWTTVSGGEVPLVPGAGLVVCAAAVVWVVAVLSDWAAFRLAAAGEALIPAGIVFVLVAVAGTDEGRILYPALTVGCAVAFGLMLRAAQAAPRRGTAARRLRPPAGAATACWTVAGGLLITSALAPTLSGGPLGSWLESAEERRGPVVVALSPLAGVPGRLLEDPQRELFTVTSPQRAYWRLTALGSYDGWAWSLDGRTSPAGERLPDIAEVTAPVTEVSQTYTIGSLASVWLPAAYRPVGFDAGEGDFEARFEVSSATLLVGTGSQNSDGLRYRVTSAVARFDAESLRSLRTDPAEVDATFSAVPQNLPGALAGLAAAVTAGAEGPYEQALALQNWFRRSFEYDLEVAPGHSTERLSGFLLTEQRGYCEQFAGGFAVLGRTLGMPTRVAVGFTPGVALEGDEGGYTTYSVRGEHAHAWPEVYISGAGWVPFEPTPGRGAPGAQAYTFVPEQQDSPGPSLEPTLAPADPSPTPAPPAATGGEPDPAVTTGPAAAGGGWAATARRVAAIVGLSAAGLLGAAVLYAGACAGLGALHRRRTQRWARGDARRGALAAWEEALRAGGIGRAPAETPLEVAQRAATALAMPPTPWRRLALCISVAVYSAPPAPPDIATAAGAAAGEITDSLRQRLTRAQRLRALFDPWPWRLLMRRRASEARGGEAATARG